MKKYLLTFLLVIINTCLWAQTGTVYGKVTSELGVNLEFVNVSIEGTSIGVVTNLEGNYEIDLHANQSITLVYSSMGFLVQTKRVNLKNRQRLNIDVKLDNSSEQIEQVLIEDKQVRKSTLMRLDPKIASVIPSATGNFESIIKTMPGVSSNNELSSQYSVRGGNFDENLVYVNGIEIFKPFLIKAGQQEGLSFINPDMVSSILFSAGGFESKYGDKMSSALDIKYQKPLAWGGAFSASLLGASAMLQGDSKTHRFRHITGFRYQSTRYVLKSLETKGSYDPKFLDVQTYMSYDISEKLQLSFLGNLANNSYTFIPKDRHTKFGKIDEVYGLSMYFDGQEVDEFLTMTGAFDLDYMVNNDFNLKLITSVFNTNERETFDIQNQYYINEIDMDQSSGNLGDSIGNKGYGTGLEHARNYLNATISSVEHKGNLKLNQNFLQWGIRFQNEKINDNLTEWHMTDSAGYSNPRNDSVLNLYEYVHARNNLSTMRYNCFLQDSYSSNIKNSKLNISGGLRASYWDFNKELLVSPRLSFALKPDWKKDILFKFATGYYYQPAFYKEMRNPKGELNSDIKAQQSIHFVLASDYNFIAWNRPFKLITEAYYKVLHNLVTYSVDNVRIIYSGNNDANGYAMGIDLKVNGEFVKGVDSWLSMSLMKTEEDVKSDGYGYIPRPSDQRFKVSVFFQDYFPGNPSYKMHLALNFATGLPFGPPKSPRYMQTGRMQSYQRVDIGFSKVLKDAKKEYPKGHFLHHLNDAWISFEVFNILDRSNTISHEWVTDFYNRQYAVENTLTRRRLNLKLSANF